LISLHFKCVCHVLPLTNNCIGIFQRTNGNGECWTCILGETWCIQKFYMPFLHVVRVQNFLLSGAKCIVSLRESYMWMSWDSMSKDECLMHYVVQMKTEAFSQNIGRVSLISKLVSRNSLCSFITANSDQKLGWRLQGLCHLFKLSHTPCHLI